MHSSTSNSAASSILGSMGDNPFQDLINSLKALEELGSSAEKAEAISQQWNNLLKYKEDFLKTHKITIASTTLSNELGKEHSAKFRLRLLYLFEGTNTFNAMEISESYLATLLNLLDHAKGTLKMPASQWANSVGLPAKLLQQTTSTVLAHLITLTLYDSDSECFMTPAFIDALTQISSTDCTKFCAVVKELVPRIANPTQRLSFLAKLDLIHMPTGALGTPEVRLPHHAADNRIGFGHYNLADLNIVLTEVDLFSVLNNTPVSALFRTKNLFSEFIKEQQQQATIVNMPKCRQALRHWTEDVLTDVLNGFLEPLQTENEKLIFLSNIDKAPLLIDFSKIEWSTELVTKLSDEVLYWIAIRAKLFHYIPPELHRAFSKYILNPKEAHHSIKTFNPNQYDFSYLPLPLLLASLSTANNNDGRWAERSYNSGTLQCMLQALHAKMLAADHPGISATVFCCLYNKDILSWPSGSGLYSFKELFNRSFSTLNSQHQHMMK